MAELITTEEAAAEADVSTPTIRRWIADGVLKARRAGGRYLVDLQDLQDLLDDLDAEEDEEDDADDEDDGNG